MASNLESRISGVAARPLTEGVQKLTSRVGIGIRSAAAGLSYMAAQRYAPAVQNALNNSLPYLPALYSVVQGLFR